MTRVFQAIDGMNWILRHVVGAMLGAMVLIVALQIVVRFVLPLFGIVTSVPWSEELARYLMVWCIFLGAGVSTRAGDLIAMESVADALPPAGKLWVKTVSYVVTIAFLGMLIWLGWAWVEFGEGETSTVMNIPTAWVYLSLPVGAVVAILNICVRLIETHAGHRLASVSSERLAEAEDAAPLV